MGKNVYESNAPIMTSLQVGLPENERQIQLDIAASMPFFNPNIWFIICFGTRFHIIYSG
ncbi:hypothetical protein OL548_00910 [Lysinibacillus sp. MHQ-1]|nr:hypothetical protein OL548_00910 [Lysinibacillus sp. MHQ-1]